MRFLLLGSLHSNKMVNNITKKWLINSQEKLQCSCYVGIKTGYGVESDELDPLALRKASLRRVYLTCDLKNENEPLPQVLRVCLRSEVERAG